jgi:hypothetical protein
MAFCDSRWALTYRPPGAVDREFYTGIYIGISENFRIFFPGKIPLNHFLKWSSGESVQGKRCSITVRNFLVLKFFKFVILGRNLPQSYGFFAHFSSGRGEKRKMEKPISYGTSGQTARGKMTAH